MCCSGCAPAWPETASDDGDDAPVQVRVVPEAPASALPRVVQFEVTPAPSMAPLDVTQWRLFRGKLGHASMSQLEEQAPSASLLQRVVPAVTYATGNGAIRLVPRTPLDAGEVYSLAAGEPLFAQDFAVAARTSLPFMSLVWPPQGHGAGALFGVWCLPAAVAGSPPDFNDLPPLQLQPAGIALSLTGGLSEEGGHHCVRVASQIFFDPSEQVLPPVLRAADGKLLARLDPTPLAANAPLPEPTSSACEEGEVPFGPGCATIADDRLWLRSAHAGLWSIALPGYLDEVWAAQAGQRLLLQPLPPDSALTFRVATIALDGTRSDDTIEVTTLAPMAHVIINEVLANPFGPEPHQEWVELYNDGNLPAALEKYRIRDIGGDAWLPQATLLPGGYALLVKDTFDDEADYDVMFPEDAMVLRLPALGKNGLNNSGEPLKLVDGDDNVLSRSPAEPKPVAGHSVARRPAGNVADEESAFAIALPTPGAANDLESFGDER